MNKFNTIHLHTVILMGLMMPMNIEAIGWEYQYRNIDHSPVPLDSSYMKNDLPKYINELNYLKKTYGKNINVYTGMELDYIKVWI